MTERAARLSTAAVATIANGASQSGAIDVSDYVIAAIQMPTSWTTAAITFLASATKDGTYYPVYDDAGTEVTIASANAAASRVIVNKAVIEQLAGLRWIKLRSGTEATPVNQGGSRAVFVMLKS